MALPFIAMTGTSTVVDAVRLPLERHAETSRGYSEGLFAHMDQ